jgi:Methylase involved in ubiquinone/menaquinone biosynthesis
MDSFKNTIQTIKKYIPTAIKLSFRTILKGRPKLKAENLNPLNMCLCCGSASLIETPVLWESLINGWELSAAETDYINRQQGLHCQRCKTRLRGMTLAYAMMRMNSYQGFYKDFVKTTWMRRKKILEINRADWLTQYLNQVPGHILCSYPEVDIQKLPYADNSFDIVVHSDTLEHVEDPLRAMRECQRVLKPNGFCAFTTPGRCRSSDKVKSWIIAQVIMELKTKYPKTILFTPNLALMCGNLPFRLASRKSAPIRWSIPRV